MQEWQLPPPNAQDVREEKQARPRAMCTIIISGRERSPSNTLGVPAACTRSMVRPIASPV